MLIFDTFSSIEPRNILVAMVRNYHTEHNCCSPQNKEQGFHVYCSIGDNVKEEADDFLPRVHS